MRSSLLPVLLLALASPASAQSVLATFEGVQDGDRFGDEFDVIGDVDGDGIADLVVGVADDATAGTDSGRVDVISGADGSLVRTHYGHVPFERLGATVSDAGDVNGDSVPDYVAGSPVAHGGRGAAWVYSGLDGSELYFLRGINVGDEYAYSLDAAGDANGDGFADVVVGAPGFEPVAFPPGHARGKVYVISGATGTLLHEVVGSAIHVARFGSTVVGIGDWNGDGRDDVAAEAPLGADFAEILRHYWIVSGATGEVLHGELGSTGAFEQTFVVGFALSTAGDLTGDGQVEFTVGRGYPINQDFQIAVVSGNGATLRSFDVSDHPQSRARFAGDMNGDGLGDHALVKPDPISGFDADAEIEIRSGYDGSVLHTFTSSVPEVTRFGAEVRSVGDFDGDGADDLAIGMPAYDAGGNDRGRIVVFAGSPEGPAPSVCQVVHLEPTGGGDIEFGLAAAVSGPAAIVGARLDTPSGSAQFYELSPTGTWTASTFVHASDGAAGNDFGASVAISGSTAVVAARADSGGGTQSGAAYVFERSPGGTWLETAKLTASPPVAFARFGDSVATSGERILVGDPFGDGVYVFARQGTAWVEEALLTATSSGFFGFAVAIDGDVAVVGDTHDGDIAAFEPGSAFVFERQAGVWVETARLRGSDVLHSGLFGSSVSVDGARILVGAQTTRDAYVFEEQGGTWVEVAKLDGDFGDGVSLSRDRALVGFRVYAELGGSWSQVHYLQDVDGAPGFGAPIAPSRNLSLSGITAIVGAHTSNSAYLFTLGDCQPGAAYCHSSGCPCGNDDPDAGCANSTGAGALLAATGSTSLGADDLTLTAEGCPPGNSGLFILGSNTAATPVTVGDGLACSGGLFRYVPSVVSPSGALVLDHPIANAPPGWFAVGATRTFQAWTRDVLCGPPPAPCPSPCGQNNNLSNAYSVVITP